MRVDKQTVYITAIRRGRPHGALRPRASAARSITWRASWRPTVRAALPLP